MTPAYLLLPESSKLQPIAGLPESATVYRVQFRPPHGRYVEEIAFPVHLFHVRGDFIRVVCTRDDLKRAGRLARESVTP